MVSVVIVTFHPTASFSTSATKFWILRSNGHILMATNSPSKAENSREREGKKQTGFEIRMEEGQRREKNTLTALWRQFKNKQW